MVIFRNIFTSIGFMAFFLNAMVAIGFDVASTRNSKVQDNSDGTEISHKRFETDITDKDFKMTKNHKREDSTNNTLNNKLPKRVTSEQTPNSDKSRNDTHQKIEENKDFDKQTDDDDKAFHRDSERNKNTEIGDSSFENTSSTKDHSSNDNSKDHRPKKSFRQNNINLKSKNAENNSNESANSSDGDDYQLVPRTEDQRVSQQSHSDSKEDNPYSDLYFDDHRKDSETETSNKDNQSHPLNTKNISTLNGDDDQNYSGLHISDNEEISNKEAGENENENAHKVSEQSSKDHLKEKDVEALDSEYWLSLLSKVKDLVCHKQHMRAQETIEEIKAIVKNA